MYDGAWHCGLRHGLGAFVAEGEGDKYDGQWMADRKHGTGAEIGLGGGVFRGTFWRGRRHGCGTFSWPAGGRTENREYVHGAVVSAYTVEPSHGHAAAGAGHLSARGLAAVVQRPSIGTGAGNSSLLGLNMPLALARPSPLSHSPSAPGALGAAAAGGSSGGSATSPVGRAGGGGISGGSGGSIIAAAGSAAGSAAGAAASHAAAATSVAVGVADGASGGSVSAGTSAGGAAPAAGAASSGSGSLSGRGSATGGSASGSSSPSLLEPPAVGGAGAGSAAAAAAAAAAAGSALVSMPLPLPMPASPAGLFSGVGVPVAVPLAPGMSVSAAVAAAAGHPGLTAAVRHFLRHSTTSDVPGGVAGSGGSIVTVTLTDTIEVVITRMTDNNVLSVPVYDASKERFVAVLHLLDICAFMLDLVSKKKASFSPAHASLRETLAHQRRFASAAVSEVLEMRQHISPIAFSPLPSGAPLIYAVHVLAGGAHAVPIIDSGSGRILRMLTQVSERRATIVQRNTQLARDARHLYLLCLSVPRIH